MSAAPAEEPKEPQEPLVAPDAEQWAAMTPAQKERFLVAVNEEHTSVAKLMTEGQPHKKAVRRAFDELSLHFSSKNRAIYLGEDMSVVYPAERTFAPDLFAVLDVNQPDDDERLSWVVADEGRGPDLVLEVLYLGDRKKDLVRNVEWFARLGIAEYFLFDRRRLELHGFRLPKAGAKKYTKLRPRLGRLTSEVLGPDLAVVGKELRFYSGHAELVGSADLIERLSGMMDDIEARAEAEHQQAEAERERAEAQERALLESLRQSIALILEARGLEVPEEVRARLEACREAPTLQRWMSQAATIDDPRQLDDED